MAELTIDMIQRASMSFLEYQKGRSLYFGHNVRLTRNESFWRGEYEVSGEGTEGGECFTVSLEISEGKIKSFRCNSCIHTGKKLCRHAVAASLLWLKESAEQTERVRTTPSANRMIDAYAARNYNRASALGRGEIRLEPKLLLDRGTARLECRIGWDKLYVIQDFNAFAVAMRNRESVVYGKNTLLVHDRALFDEWSAKLCDLITGTVWAEKEAGTLVYYKQSKKLRHLTLSPALTDQFMELVQGRTLTVEETRRELRAESRMSITLASTQSNTAQKPVVEEDPVIPLLVSKKGLDGVHFELPSELSVFPGEKRIYISWQDKLFYCSRKFSDSAGMFLDMLYNHSYPDCGQFDLNEKDMAKFCRQVLPQIQQYLQMQECDISLDGYCPDKLVTKFYLDQRDDGMIVCNVVHSYGSWEFNPLLVAPLEGPESKSRDEAGELQVYHTVGRYFYRSLDGTELVTPDEDSVFLLLTEGIEKLNALGKVYATEKISQVKSLRSRQTQIGVSLEGNLLNLKIDTEGIDRQELFSILESYQQKKKYHRLKDGSYLNLTESGLSSVSDLVTGLGLGKKELNQSQISLPAYRALYINQVLGEDQGISGFRNQAYERLIQGMDHMMDVSVTVPEAVQDTLRPYQAEGYRWLKTLEQYGFGGILADDMGLGKTLQVIALLLSQPENSAPSLIVCPTSLIYNWEHEFGKFAPDMKVLPVTGTAEERKALLQNMTEYDAVITSYDLLRRDEALYSAHTFRYMIIDEAQYIKNHTTQNAKAVKSIRAEHKAALTGTPIENRLSELWSIFDFLMPGFLYSYTRFRADYERAIVKEKDEEVIRRLRRMLQPFILRRLKQDVLQDLPEKTEQVVFTGLRGVQKQLYQASVLQLREQIEGQSGTEYQKSKLQLLSQLMRLRQICCDPALCFEGYDGESAKTEVCMELIEDCIASGHKLLLFSQFTSMLERLERKLQEKNTDYYKLTGDTSKEERQQLVEAFQKDQVPVFLISLKAGGTGLNLTAADIVIHYDPWWNVAAQNQATDRTHRIGQENPVTVYKLIARDTIEERILKLQESKQDLSEQILSGHGESLSHLSKEELLEILS